MSEPKEVLKTGEVAGICRVSDRTVILWCDKGLLRCFRVPGSTHRRILRSELAAFMNENGMPLEWLNGESV